MPYKAPTIPPTEPRPEATGSDPTLRLGDNRRLLVDPKTQAVVQSQLPQEDAS